MTTAVARGQSSSAAEPAWEIAELFPRQGNWSETEYLALNTNRLVELSDGCVEVLLLPTEFHQAIVILLCNLLRAFVRGDNDARVLPAPFSVRVAGGRLRQPDVLCMSGSNAHRRQKRVWDAAVFTAK
jgi:Uma2 family endonuclease